MGPVIYMGPIYWIVKFSFNYKFNPLIFAIKLSHTNKKRKRKYNYFSQLLNSKALAVLLGRKSVFMFMHKLACVYIYIYEEKLSSWFISFFQAYSTFHIKSSITLIREKKITLIHSCTQKKHATYEENLPTSHLYCIQCSNIYVITSCRPDISIFPAAQKLPSKCKRPPGFTR